MDCAARAWQPADAPPASSYGVGRKINTGALPGGAYSETIFMNRGIAMAELYPALYKDFEVHPLVFSREFDKFDGLYVGLQRSKPDTGHVLYRNQRRGFLDRYGDRIIDGIHVIGGFDRHDYGWHADVYEPHGNLLQAGHVYLIGNAGWHHERLQCHQ